MKNAVLAGAVAFGGMGNDLISFGSAPVPGDGVLRAAKRLSEKAKALGALHAGRDAAPPSRQVRRREALKAAKGAAPRMVGRRRAWRKLWATA